jgi:hypothetical protein
MGLDSDKINTHIAALLGTEKENMVMKNGLVVPASLAGMIVTDAVGLSLGVNGEVLRVSTITIDPSICVTAIGSQTEVGKSKNTYTIDWGKTESSNYVIKEELGTLTVTEVEVTAPDTNLDTESTQEDVDSNDDISEDAEQSLATDDIEPKTEPEATVSEPETEPEATASESTQEEAAKPGSPQEQATASDTEYKEVNAEKAESLEEENSSISAGPNPSGQDTEERIEESQPTGMYETTAGSEENPNNSTMRMAAVMFIGCVATAAVAAYVFANKKS